MAQLRFTRAEAELLLEGPATWEAALQLLALQSVLVAHEQLGGAEAMMERTRDYAKARFAFGQPIGAFQAVKHRIAELYILVELARANAISAAAAQDRPGFISLAAAARLSASEAYDTATRDAIQLHGGVGVTWELGLHLHLRRARVLGLEQGAAAFWEDILAGRILDDTT